MNKDGTYNENILNKDIRAFMHNKFEELIQIDPNAVRENYFDKEWGIWDIVVSLILPTFDRI